MDRSIPRPYTPKEVASLLQVNIITVHRWLRSGELKGVKLGGSLWRVSPDQLQTFLSRNKEGGS